MRVRLLTFSAVAGLCVAALPSQAASAPTPQITDPAGDANGVNDQGVGAPIPSTATPADVSAADITSVLFQSTFKTATVKGKTVKTPTGFTVTMTLSAPPTTPELFYRVVGTITGCTQVFFEYGTDVVRGGTTVRCPSTVPTQNKIYSTTPAVIKGSTITWTLPISAFPVGTTFSALQAQTRGNPVEATVPQIDGATSSATFTVGK